MAILGDAIYSLGGYDGSNCLNSVERFDQGSESWKYTRPISVTRTFPGKLFCFLLQKISILPKLAVYTRTQAIYTPSLQTKYVFCPTNKKMKK